MKIMNKKLIRAIALAVVTVMLIGQGQVFGMVKQGAKALQTMVKEIAKRPEILGTYGARGGITEGVPAQVGTSLPTGQYRQQFEEFTKQSGSELEENVPSRSGISQGVPVQMQDVSEPFSSPFYETNFPESKDNQCVEQPQVEQGQSCFEESTDFKNYIKDAESNEADLPVRDKNGNPQRWVLELYIKDLEDRLKVQPQEVVVEKQLVEPSRPEDEGKTSATEELITRAKQLTEKIKKERKELVQVQETAQEAEKRAQEAEERVSKSKQQIEELGRERETMKLTIEKSKTGDLEKDAKIKELSEKLEQAVVAKTFLEDQLVQAKKAPVKPVMESKEIQARVEDPELKRLKEEFELKNKEIEKLNETHVKELKARDDELAAVQKDMDTLREAQTKKEREIEATVKQEIETMVGKMKAAIKVKEAELVKREEALTSQLSNLQVESGKAVEAVEKKYKNMIDGFEQRIKTLEKEKEGLVKKHELELINAQEEGKLAGKKEVQGAFDTAQEGLVKKYEGDLRDVKTDADARVEKIKTEGDTKLSKKDSEIDQLQKEKDAYAKIIKQQKTALEEFGEREKALETRHTLQGRDLEAAQKKIKELTKSKGIIGQEKDLLEQKTVELAKKTVDLEKKANDALKELKENTELMAREKGELIKREQKFKQKRNAPRRDRFKPRGFGRNYSGEGSGTGEIILPYSPIEQERIESQIINPIISEPVVAPQPQGANQSGTQPAQVPGAPGITSFPGSSMPGGTGQPSSGSSQYGQPSGSGTQQEGGAGETPASSPVSPSSPSGYPGMSPFQEGPIEESSPESFQGFEPALTDFESDMEQRDGGGKPEGVSTLVEPVKKKVGEDISEEGYVTPLSKKKISEAEVKAAEAEKKIIGTQESEQEVEPTQLDKGEALEKEKAPEQQPTQPQE